MPERVQMTRQKGGWRKDHPDAVIAAPPIASLAMEMEDRVLAAVLHHVRYCDFGTDTFLSFAIICDLTGLNRDFVRAACRALTDRGLMAYYRALWCGDGFPCGAGYGITRAGVKYLHEKGKAT